MRYVLIILLSCFSGLNLAEETKIFLECRSDSLTYANTEWVTENNESRCELISSFPMYYSIDNTWTKISRTTYTFTRYIWTNEGKKTGSNKWRYPSACHGEYKSFEELLEQAKKTGMAIEYKEKRLDKAEYLINKPSDISDTVLYKPDEITLINEKWRNHAIVINRLNGNYISTSNAMNKSGKCKSITEQEFLKEQDHLIRMVDAIGQAEAKFAKQNRKF